MKIVFYHISSTGCGLFAIKLMQNEFKKLDTDVTFKICDVNKLMHEANAGRTVAFEEGDLYIFSTFADVFKISPAMEHFLKLDGLDIAGKRVATFDTNGGAPGIIPQQFNTLVSKKKGIHLGHVSLRFLSNNYHKEKNGKIVPISPKVYDDVKNFVEEVYNKQVSVKFGIGKHVGEKLHLGCAKLLQKTMKQSLKLKLLIGGKLRVESDKCIGCTICEQHCPAFCYDMVEKKAVLSRPNQCYGCLRCIHNCPTHAIQGKNGVEYQQFKFKEYLISDKTGLQSVEQLESDFKASRAE